MRRFASLRRQADFAKLRSRGGRTATPHLTIFRSDALPSDARTLAGIAVSKDVGGSVVRNRVKRRIAASLHEVLPQGARLRLLLIARPSAARASYAELRSQIGPAVR